VTDISYRQWPHNQRLQRTVHLSTAAQRGQLQPEGQRNAARYSMHASSLENRFSNSSNVRG